MRNYRKPNPIGDSGGFFIYPEDLTMEQAAKYARWFLRVAMWRLAQRRKAGK